MFAGNWRRTSLLRRLTCLLALPAGARPDYVCEAVNYAALGSAADRHRGGPSPRCRSTAPRRDQRDSALLSPTRRKECDCRLAQPQDVWGRVWGGRGGGRRQSLTSACRPTLDTKLNSFLRFLLPLVIQFRTIFRVFFFNSLLKNSFF